MKISPKTKTIGIAFIVGMISMFIVSTYLSEKNRSARIAKMILTNTDLFPLGKETEVSARAYFNDYKHMTKKRMSTVKAYREATSPEEARRIALNKCMEVLTSDIQASADTRSSFGPALTATLGSVDANNFLVFHVARKSAFTEAELETYTKNMKIILEAIPNNLPNRNVLKKFLLSDVRYYETFAKVRFREDDYIDRLNKRKEVFRGQMY